MSPTPSPAPAPNFHSRSCEGIANSCHDQGNITACVRPSENRLEESILLVQNGGHSLAKMNITIDPLNNTYQNISVPGQQVKEINISSNVGGELSIVVNAGKGDCVIHIEVPGPQGNTNEQAPYFAYVSPINGAYIIFATASLVGGIWACCKLGKKEGYLDGVQYQELEMAQPQSLSSRNVEVADGWDRSWDDDWDEEKAVKSRGISHLENGLTNGSSSSSGEVKARKNNRND